MKCSPPWTSRELFERISLFEGSGNIESIFSNIDWSSVRPVHLYLCLLGRLPECLEVSIPGASYSPSSHFFDILNSDEFQRAIVAGILRAFPEKRRLIFVHVPKCAGSDLLWILSNRFPWIIDSISYPEWTGKDVLFESLRNILRKITASSAITVGGHGPLQSIMSSNIYRGGDDIFTILRNPVERALSSANYSFSLIMDEANSARPDYREWVSIVGSDRVDKLRKLKVSGKNSKYLAGARDLARELLYSGSVVAPNTMCNFVGRGDAASAIELMALTNIEVTVVTQYERWLLDRWGFDRSIRVNESIKVLRVDNISRRDLEYIESISVEDMRLYRRVSTVIDNCGNSSIRGLDLIG